MNVSKSHSFIISILACIVFLFVGSWLLFNKLFCQNGVFDYVADRDKLAIKKMFHDDWQLLYFGDFDKISEDDFDVDFMLDNRSSSQYSANHNLVLKVLRQDNKTIGFLAYYPRSAYWWHMLFLIVDVDYRKSGNASKLVRFMIDDAVARGALKVTTFTRLINTKARAVYEGKFKFKNIGDPYLGTADEGKYLDLVLYPKKK